MSSIESVAAENFKQAFVDPSVLATLADNKNISDDVKIQIACQKFEESILAKQFESATKPLLKNSNLLGNLQKGYAGTFLPELYANSICRSDQIFGLYEHFKPKN